MDKDKVGLGYWVGFLLVVVFTPTTILCLLLVDKECLSVGVQGGDLLRLIHWEGSGDKGATALLRDTSLASAVAQRQSEEQGLNECHGIKYPTSEAVIYSDCLLNRFPSKAPRLLHQGPTPGQAENRRGYYSPVLVGYLEVLSSQFIFLTTYLSPMSHSPDFLLPLQSSLQLHSSSCDHN